MQIGDRLLHHARRFHDLRQEHFAGAKQIADDVHAGHQRAFDDVQRLWQFLPGFFGIGFDEFGDAVNERVRQAVFNGFFAPREILFLGLDAAFAFEAGGGVQQAVGRVIAAVEDHVFAQFAQVGRDVVIKRELAGVDDAHVHAGLDGVIQEHGVHGFAHRLVAAERERQVRDAARDMDERHFLL